MTTLKDGPTRIVTDKQGVEYRSTYTTAEAATICTDLVMMDFAQNIVRLFNRGTASERQIDWIHILAMRATESTQHVLPAPVTVTRPVFTNLRAIFAKAREDRRMLKFTIPTRANITISLCARRDYVSVETRGGTYLGKMEYADGTFYAVRGIRDEIVKELALIESDPHGYMKQSGLTSGICCYCGRDLTDIRSVNVGYGPVCARYHGLPWGE